MLWNILHYLAFVSFKLHKCLPDELKQCKYKYSYFIFFRKTFKALITKQNLSVLSLMLISCTTISCAYFFVDIFVCDFLSRNKTLKH
jgi:hypothetical protein